MKIKTFVYFASLRISLIDANYPTTISGDALKSNQTMELTVHLIDVFDYIREKNTE